MTTNTYWAEVENAATGDSRVYWAEVDAAVDATTVYWAEVESSLLATDAAYGSADLPSVETITLVGGGSTQLGSTVDLTVTVEDQDGDPIPNVSPAPASSDNGIATAALLSATDANGEATVRVTPVSAGSVSVTATLDGKTSASSNVTVSVAVSVVTTVTLSVPTIGLEVGTTGSATVTVLDQDGDPMSGVSVTWSSSNDAVIADPAAGVTGSSGTATVALPALAAGTTSIGVSAGGVSGTPVTVTVFAVADPPTYSGSGSAQIIVTAESRLAGWERPKVRRFNDADQKKLYPTDRFFEGMVEGVEVEVVWPSKEVLRRYA